MVLIKYPHQYREEGGEGLEGEMGLEGQRR